MTSIIVYDHWKYIKVIALNTQLDLLHVLNELLVSGNPQLHLQPCANKLLLRLCKASWDILSHVVCISWAIQVNFLDNHLYQFTESIFPLNGVNIFQNEQ